MRLLIFVYQKLPLNNMNKRITLINLVFLSLWVILKFANEHIKQALKNKLKSEAVCKFFYKWQTILNENKTNLNSNLLPKLFGFNQLVIKSNYKYSVKYKNILHRVFLVRQFKFVIS